jgi:hypothetical protein
MGASFVPDLSPEPRTTLRKTAFRPLQVSLELCPKRQVPAAVFGNRDFGLTQHAQCIGDPLGLFEHNGQIPTRIEPLWLEPDRFLETSHALVQATLTSETQAEPLVRVSVPRFEREYASASALRVGKPTLKEENESEQIQRPHVAGLLGEHVANQMLRASIRACDGRIMSFPQKR